MPSRSNRATNFATATAVRVAMPSIRPLSRAASSSEQPLSRGVLAQPLDGRLADPAGRRVDDPQEGGVVARIVQQAPGSRRRP